MKGNLGLYEGKSVSDKYQSFTVRTPAMAMVQWESCGLLRVTGSKPLSDGCFSLKVNFDDILSLLTKIYEPSV